MRNLAFALAASAVALLPAAPAIAAASGSESASNSRSQEAEERMICRRIERSGSRMSTQRICRTARQWAAARSGQSVDEELDETLGQQMDVVSRDINTGCSGGMSGGAGPR